MTQHTIEDLGSVPTTEQSVQHTLRVSVLFHHMVKNYSFPPDWRKVGRLYLRVEGGEKCMDTNGENLIAIAE